MAPDSARICGFRMVRYLTEPGAQQVKIQVWLIKAGICLILEEVRI